MEVSEAEVEGLMGVVRQRLKKQFGRRFDFEDLLAEGYAGMWDHLVRAPEGSVKVTIALNGALWKVTEYLRGPKNTARRESRKGVTLPRVVSFTDLPERVGVADFVEALTRRTALEAAVPDWEIVRRTLIEGETYREVAAALSTTVEDIAKRRRAALLVLSERRELWQEDWEEEDG